GGDAVAGELGPIRIGELQLDVPAQDWSVALTQGSAVDAAFDLVDLSPAFVAVPEPDVASGLAAGALSLLGVATVRRRGGRGNGVVRVASRVSAVLALVVASPALAQDVDADGVPDASDNCVYAANPLQEDT